MKAKWLRSRSEKMLGGVCGGLSSYLGLDVTLIRVFFIAAAMASGLGVALYVILWLITPPQDAAEETSRDQAARIAIEEMQSQARHLSEEAQSAMDSDNPQVRMIVRWSLALLIGLALHRARPRRRPGRHQHAHHVREQRGPQPHSAEAMREELAPDSVEAKETE